MLPAGAGPILGKKAMGEHDPAHCQNGSEYVTVQVEGAGVRIE